MAKKDSNEVSWEAHEYVHHEKDILWYVAYISVVSGVLAIVYYVLEGDIISMITISLMAIALLIYANRKPQTLKYRIHDGGVSINEREYSFADFKSFSIITTGQIESIYLEPLKRYMPPISIFYEPKDADKIFELLGSNLPSRQYQPDIIDNLVHRFRI